MELAAKLAMNLGDYSTRFHVGGNATLTFLDNTSLYLHALSFSKVALLGSKPPPQMNQERGAALERPLQSGTTLLYSFLGRGGEEEKDV